MRRSASMMLILVLFIALTDRAVAADLHVNNSIGDDRYDGLSAELYGDRGGPFRSISRALRSAQVPPSPPQ